MALSTVPHLAELGITTEQEANLRKLAAYLMTLPADYPDFEMNNYAQGGYGGAQGKAIVPPCGTAACAVGHAPAAGIAPDGIETWYEYSHRTLIDGEYEDAEEALDAWEWCFGASWSKSDNTVHGAAKRITWLLGQGLPEDHRGQKHGHEPLCYTDIQVPVA